MRFLLVALATLSLVAFAAPGVKATLHDAEGKTVGTASLTQEDGGVRVQVTVTGIAPGPHAFHVHAVGTCKAPDFTSAGPHFNPGMKEHGQDNPKGSHMGDLPNLTVDAAGTGTGNFVVHGATLGPGPDSLLQSKGTALVLHTAADDLKSDPAGNAGTRIACGVIERTR
jgi:Cu-Zn family superoxide dismutase